MAFTYLPNSYQSALLKARAEPKGRYDKLSKHLTSLGPRAFSAARYDKDFFPREMNTFSNNRMFIFPNNNEAEFTFCGKIIGENFGTCLGALGTFYKGTKHRPNYVTDEAKARYSIALACPSYATKAMKVHFNNTVCTIQELMQGQEKEDAQQGKEYEIKDPLKVPPNDEYAIILHSPESIYTQHKQAKATPYSSPKKRVLKRKAEDNAEDLALPTLTSPTASTVGVDQSWPENVPFPVDRLPNATGVSLASKYDCLNQQPFYNAKGELIPPWMHYTALRPGSLVMATVAVMVWAPKPDENFRTQTPSKISQLYICSLHVVGLSDMPVTRPLPRKDEDIDLNDGNTSTPSSSLPETLTLDLPFEELPSLDTESGSVDPAPSDDNAKNHVVAAGASVNTIDKVARTDNRSATPSSGREDDEGVDTTSELNGSGTPEGGNWIREPADGSTPIGGGASDEGPSSPFHDFIATSAPQLPPIKTGDSPMHDLTKYLPPPPSVNTRASAAHVGKKKLKAKH
ncbi:hypothetical protein PM082_008816 [Marasmius tenuissimus]|nr:hypothetical protein PM082_008816 [Marasmius tenuissimus]